MMRNMKMIFKVDDLSLGDFYALCICVKNFLSNKDYLDILKDDNKKVISLIVDKLFYNLEVYEKK